MSAAPSVAVTAAPISSLKYGKCQSSGSSTTPSSEMNRPAMILRMIASPYRLLAAMGANREYWPWKVTVTVSVGPLRCLDRIRSASPLRADSGS